MKKSSLTEIFWVNWRTSRTKWTFTLSLPTFILSLFLDLCTHISLSICSMIATRCGIHIMMDLWASVDGITELWIHDIYRPVMTSQEWSILSECPPRIKPMKSRSGTPQPNSYSIKSISSAQASRRNACSDIDRSMFWYRSCIKFCPFGKSLKVNAQNYTYCQSVNFCGKTIEGTDRPCEPVTSMIYWCGYR